MTCVIIAHTRFEDAISVLAADLARDQVLDPLATHTLLVQGGVVGRWISTELALRSAHGIAAGIDFKPVGSFCRSLVQSGRQDPYALEALIWTVDAALEDAEWLAGVAEGDDLRQALGHLDRAGRHAMAVHFAGILDRYQLERPAWIRAWSTRSTVAEAHTVPWLAALWQRTLAHACGLPPLSMRIEELIQRLRPGASEGPEKVASCPPRLWVLAPSTLPPLLIRLLTALGDGGGKEVRILHLVPAGHASMWAALENEDESYDPEITPMDPALGGAHPLLAAFARQAHDLGVLLAEQEAGGARTIDLDHVLQHPVPDNASLLLRLQQQVWSATSGPLTLAATDRSLLVHRCHSPLREVEVLRDVLVDVLTAPGAPRPDEVLIAVTDLATYAPLLSAFIGEERGDHVRFPVAVVGLPASSDPLVVALLALLALPGTAASLEQVLEPLSAPAMQRRFGLTEQTLMFLRQRLEQSGISWGLDSGHRQRASGYDSNEGSWRAGLDRLLLGLMTGPEQSVLEQFHPAGGVLLGDDAGIGGIALYVDIVGDFSAAVGNGTKTKSISEWRQLLFSLIADVAEPESGNEVRAVSLVRGAIAAIPLQAADPDLRTILKHLNRMLEDEGQASTWSRGGVTVAPLSALRHAPHAVIAILGLDSSFPNVPAASTFDPAASHRQRGDRSSRLDARQTFLDLLLATRSRLHLSWTGFAAADGSFREPSSVIEDLLRYVDGQVTDLAGNRLNRSAIVLEHRLHGSDPAYFNGQLPRSYDRLAWAAVSARRARDAGELAPTIAPFLQGDSGVEAPASVAPDDLRGWLIDPAKAFAETVLGLRFSRHETLPECEPIELDNVEYWELRQRLLETVIAGRPLDEQRLRQDGVLPHGALGTTLLAQVQDEAETVHQTLQAVLPNQGTTVAELLSRSLPIDLALESSAGKQRITGHLSRCDGRVALCLHSGSLNGKHLLAAWVMHQLANAHCRQVKDSPQQGITTLLIGKAKDKPSKSRLWDSGACQFTPESATVAHCQALIEAFRNSYRRPLPIFPELAAACWEWKLNELSPSLVADHVRAWQFGADEDGDGYARSELASPKPWVRLLWRGVNNPTNGWEKSCIEPLWIPALQALSSIAREDV